MVSIAGAFVVTLYEGPPLLNRLAPLRTHQLSHNGDQMKWILGGFFLGIRCVMESGWVIIQAVIFKKYPAKLIVVFFYCFFVAIQSGIVTLTMERDLSVWSLKPTFRLLAIVYSNVNDGYITPKRCDLIRCLAQLFGYTGINYSSPTLGAAMLNLVPGLTFLLAIIFRMEMLNTRNITCLAKLVGTIVSIAGAFVVTLYEGPPLLKRLATLHTHQLSLRGDQMNWILGGFFLAIDCVMASSWVIIQAIILKKYPAELIVVFFYCFFVAIQSGIVTLIVERDLSAWSLKPTLRLLAILYSAIFGSALQVGLCSWCLRRKGPVFVCMFKPLGIAIAAIAGVVFFGDTLYLGSLLGVIIIVLGFYSVMWGKSKEEKKIHAGHFSSLGFPTQKMPLLENYAEETVNAAA
uniref:WAT1-related protein n=1 Tax=Chenopodium quinoa TaxID=63459 RepID=A0A803L0E3_CHEQI